VEGRGSLLHWLWGMDALDWEGDPGESPGNAGFKQKEKC